MKKIVSNRPTITRKELEGVLDCLINEELTTGSPLKSFESVLSELAGQKFCLAVNSLTAAYHLIFKSLDLKADDEVIMPSYSPAAPLNALAVIGAKPVIVDCAENSLMPSAETIRSKISDRTRAVLVCHTFGCFFPLEDLEGLPVPLIEDISHAIGAEYNGVALGKTSAFAVASFAPSMIITTGNGGAVLTANSKYFSAMRDQRLGLEYAMTDFQSAMGISQLVKLKEFLKRRREIAKKYADAARLTSHRLPYPYNEAFAYQTFPIIFDASSESVQKYWKKNGVELTLPFERPLHHYTSSRALDYPNSERLSKKLYSVPLYPTLTKQETDLIAKLLAGFV
jgi:dTDP-4-amino-4,6-dideoxygalactose transaminase